MHSWIYYTWQNTYYIYIYIVIHRHTYEFYQKDRNKKEWLWISTWMDIIEDSRVSTRVRLVSLLSILNTARCRKNSVRETSCMKRIVEEVTKERSQQITITLTWIKVEAWRGKIIHYCSLSRHDRQFAVWLTNKMFRWTALHSAHCEWFWQCILTKDWHPLTSLHDISLEHYNMNTSRHVSKYFYIIVYKRHTTTRWTKCSFEQRVYSVEYHTAIWGTQSSIIFCYFHICDRMLFTYERYCLSHWNVCLTLSPPLSLSHTQTHTHART
jgi:hypothetical protein